MGRVCNMRWLTSRLAMTLLQVPAMSQTWAEELRLDLDTVERASLGCKLRVGYVPCPPASASYSSSAERAEGPSRSCSLAVFRKRRLTVGTHTSTTNEPSPHLTHAGSPHCNTARACGTLSASAIPAAHRPAVAADSLAPPAMPRRPDETHAGTPVPGSRAQATSRRRLAATSTSAAARPHTRSP